MIDKINTAIAEAKMQLFNPLYIQLTIQDYGKLIEDYKAMSGSKFVQIKNLYNIPVYIDINIYKSTLITEVDGFIKRINIGEN
jgi:hypothetical protein